MNTTYYNSKLKKSATEFWLNSCGLNNDDAKAIVGWLPIIYENIEYNTYIDGKVPDGEPILSEDGRHFIQKFKIVSLDKDQSDIFLKKYREERLLCLKEIYDIVESDSVITSSLGFDINANKKSISNIEDLIKLMEYKNISETEFCVADNTFHTVTLDQLTVMLYEIIEYLQKIRNNKWKLRAAIEDAQDYNSMESIDISSSSLINYGEQ